MPAPTWLHLFIDVPRPEFDAAIAFWAEVTGCPASSRRGDAGQFVTLTPRTGDAWVNLQAVGSGGGIHLDVAADGPTLRHRDDLVDTATTLGATRTTTYDDVVVLHSPGGLPFCVTPGSAAPPRLGRDTASVLDQVCLDIPAHLWDAEVAFWRDLTGRPVTPSSLDGYAGLIDPHPVGPARILLQRIDSGADAVRAHPDLAVADRPAEEARHTAAGARIVERFDWWTVLRAPGGQVYCLTDRDPATGMVD